MNIAKNEKCPMKTHSILFFLGLYFRNEALQLFALFGLLYSSLLQYPRRFARCTFRPSSADGMFDLNPLFRPRAMPPSDVLVISL